MRILWISPGFPADEQDLNCLPPLQQLASALITQGVDLHIITLGYPFHQNPYRWNGIPVVSGYGANRQWFRWYNWLRVIRYAQAAHRQEKFEGIHSFWMGPAWLIGRYLEAGWKVPHYTTLMGQDVLPQNLYRHFLTARNSQTMVAVSEYQNDIFEKTNGMRAAHTIPWGLSASDLPDHFPAHRSIDILGCGSFIALKNWELWLQVIAEVHKHKPDLRAELIGEGVDRPLLEKLIRQMGLTQVVRLSGHLPRAQVLARMQAARVFLHTARFEAFGLVMAEAAMNGCRVISTPVGIAAQLADHGLTLDLLAEKTLRALDKPLQTSSRMPFTMEETARQYQALYHS